MISCKGKCRAARAMGHWKYGGTIAYCGECRVSIDAPDRPRKCACCGQNLRYRARNPRQ